MAGIPEIPPYNRGNCSSQAVIVKNRQEMLASKFCDLMTSDMKFDSHNEYRVGFYEDVVLNVNFRILPHFSEDERFF